MAAVDMLVPGVSTVTPYARYYGLYWALSAHAEALGLDRERCQRLIRRAEVGMARISQAYDTPDHPAGISHGVNALARLAPAEGSEFAVADSTGAGSYSPRSWGFWSQYNGPSVAMGTVALDGGALRAGRHRCPAEVLAMYAPLFAVAEKGAGLILPASAFERLSLQYKEETPDLAPLRDVFTATVDGRHDPAAWTAEDRTRRATLRLLARSWQLHPQAKTWLDALADGVVFGSKAREDPVFATEDRAAAWRGVVLRHQSVGAWRRLWADLVRVVLDTDRASRHHLHEWISDVLPDSTVTNFESGLPPTIDAQGDPYPAERAITSERASAATNVAVLLLGACRLKTLSGISLRSFAGRRPTYLDPTWIAQLRKDFRNRPLAELGRRLVDDMLAQSRRVALRKVTVKSDGTINLFSRLHERNGAYFADSPEGRDNIGLRIPQLAEIATQIRLFTHDRTQPLTARGRELLELPA
ncbi:hypothetical protein Afe04nite_38710 [Asanoa ferruginea]|nr:hypothetical protein Afe04nite_38710 [Asanoa ferruginea]